MRGLSFIIALLGVFALLSLGASGAWASPASAMSCHENVRHGEMVMSGDASAPSPASDPASSPTKAQMVMGCCIACTSPALPAIPAAIGMSHPLPVQPSLFELPHGRSPAPEHGPPRLQV